MTMSTILTQISTESKQTNAQVNNKNTNSLIKDSDADKYLTYIDILYKWLELQKKITYPTFKHNFHSKLPIVD